MSRKDEVNQIQAEYIEFVKSKAKERGIREEAIVEITRSVWLYFKPDGTIESE